MKKRAKIRIKLETSRMSDLNKSRLKDDLLENDTKIKESHEREDLDEERVAVSRIKDDARYFYKFAKKKSTMKSTIGPLKKLNGELTSEPKEMAELLQSQYCMHLLGVIPKLAIKQ